MNVSVHLGLLVVGLFGCIIWPYFRSRQAKTPSGALHGVPCDFAQRRASRSNQVTVPVAIPCDERFEFTLRREGMFDHLVKALHLVRPDR